MADILSAEKFSADFSSVSGTTEEKLTELVALQAKLIEEHNKEGYECNRWYKYWRPRFQSVGKEISQLRQKLDKDSPSLSTDADGETTYDRHAEKEKEGFDTLKKSISFTDYFAGETPTKDLPDPYEDFSGYTEVDPNGDIAIGNGSGTDTKVTVTTMNQDVVAYLCKDYTADYFGDFTHNLAAKATGHTGTGTRGTFWAVSNSVGDLSDWWNGGADALVLQFYYASRYEIRIYDCMTHGSDLCAISVDTLYYHIIDREGDTVNVYIRTGSLTGTLVDFLTVSTDDEVSYRYVFPVVSVDWSQADRDSSFVVQDLDLAGSVTRSFSSSISTASSVADSDLNITRTLASAPAVASSVSDIDLAYLVAFASALTGNSQVSDVPMLASRMLNSAVTVDSQMADIALAVSRKLASAPAGTSSVSDSTLAILRKVASGITGQSSVGTIGLLRLMGVVSAISANSLTSDVALAVSRLLASVISGDTETGDEELLLRLNFVSDIVATSLTSDIDLMRLMAITSGLAAGSSMSNIDLAVTTYAALEAALSRTPIDMIVLTLDLCANTFGEGDCTATGEPCYNTWATCRDKANFSRTTKEYRFTSADTPLPFKDGERPYISKITPFATEIKTDDVTVNARVKAKFYDEADTDIGIDPYVSDRSSVQGNFWKKLLARNPNYGGRLFEWYEGFLGLIESQFERRFVGLLDNITLEKATVTVEAVDLLDALSDIDVPAEVDCELTAAITDSDTTVTVSAVDDLDESGYIRIDDEIIQYAAISGLLLTGCTRGCFSTTADSHSDGDSVQPCRYYAADNPFDILLEMLTDDAGYDSSYIDSSAFADCKAWPGGEIDFEAIISEPTSLKDLYWELIELLDCKSWVAEDLKITIARNVPNRGARSYTSLNDAENIIDGSTSGDLNEDSRVTRVMIYYDKDAIGDLEEQSSYARLSVSVDTDAESANEYGETIKKTIWCRWINSTCASEEELAYWLTEFGGRYLMNRRDPAPIIKLALERKDSALKTGEHVKLSTDELCDAAGNDYSDVKFRVTKRDKKDDGKYEYKVEQMPKKRICLINPEGAAAFDEATDAEKEYGYIGDEYGDIDGQAGYYW